MTQTTKPKRALLAYCALAERLNKPGVGAIQALTPFLSEVCRPFAGEMFDAAKLSDAVNTFYDIKIPRLAVLGLAEQLAKEGLLTADSGNSNYTVYRYPKAQDLPATDVVSPVTEAEIASVLISFIDCCRTDKRLISLDDAYLEAAFFDRLLKIDSMRLLSRREASIAAKKGADTLILKKSTSTNDPLESSELHIDFLVSQFLLDLRDNKPASFELVSNIAFASMAAEAIACFREPLNASTPLQYLTLYLDAPLLLDMLGVNTEYTDYGKELLDAIKHSGAMAAVLDHSVAEAEAAINAQLSYLRSGVNQLSVNWGTSVTPSLLTALIGNVGERAETRLGIAVHRDPEINLHRRAQSTVGDIETEMNNRMQAWKNSDAKEYDRKSVWAMLAMRDASTPCPRICDSKWIFLTRNTPLVKIANNAWTTWLRGSTKHSSTHIEKWAPVAMSDKQFAGYLWMRSGGSDASIPRARLIAHCSAAVRPRADVKARAYNLVLELSGKEEADDVAAILEDREGGRALMRATTGDPEDVTMERLPFIMEQVKLAAGEFAAARVREEAGRQLELARLDHNEKIKQLSADKTALETASALEAKNANRTLLQIQHDKETLERKNAALTAQLDSQVESRNEKKRKILNDGLAAGVRQYQVTRRIVAIVFSLACAATAYLSSAYPVITASITFLLSFVGFWFVPDELLSRPFSKLSMRKLRSVVATKDATIEIPNPDPDFKNGTWSAIDK